MLTHRNPLLGGFVLYINSSSDRAMIKFGPDARSEAPREAHTEESKMQDRTGAKLGVLWREDPEAANWRAAQNGRMRPLFEALSALSVAAEPVLYTDDAVDRVREQLFALDGVLVWVDPLVGDKDRSSLDPLLRDVAARGVWVSAHPDVILKMGTKEVLFRTRDVGWGGDVDLYTSIESFSAQLPRRLANGAPRVLKQNRGNGGIGVWKVELADHANTAATPAAVVHVQHARDRDTVVESMPLDQFIDRCAEYFGNGGVIVDQPFQPRITHGMIRCYVVQDEVVGFARQFPEGFAESGDATPSPQTLGIPSAKTMFAADEPQFTELRSKMEHDWIPAMQRVLDIATPDLPALWDADFLYGPQTADDNDTYVLCEINCSCVHPFPAQAVPKLAARAAEHVTQAKLRRR